MITRKDIEKYEIDNLAPYAVKSAFTKGRAHHEKEHDLRSVYQRDKDRIIFSAAFRRLQYKTQVFSNFEGDYYRTRLTHTIEVAQISRTIARSLKLNEDLCEAIALAHDLGHGPFGHIGETILDECMRGNGGFEHNTQSLRVVAELEDIYVHGKGLNLTWETKEGLKKHTYFESSALPLSYSTLEAQVVDVADEIAYASHDLDDGVASGLLKESDVNKLRIWKRVESLIMAEHSNVDTFQRLNLFIRYLINEQVLDLLKVSERNIREFKIKTNSDIVGSPSRVIDFSKEMRQEKQELKLFLFENFYRNKEIISIVELAEKCIKGLFNFYSKNPKLMPKHFHKKAINGKDDPYRVICDYISGMTDRFAIGEYRKLRFDM